MCCLLTAAVQSPPVITTVRGRRAAHTAVMNRAGEAAQAGLVAGGRHDGICKVLTIKQCVAGLYFAFAFKLLLNLT